jgi:GNAT superfamily N-acetyltransferase
MKVDITSIDANYALFNPYLMKSFRRLTWYSSSGMNWELDELSQLAKERKVKAKMIMAHNNNVMVGWLLISREPSDFGFIAGSYDEYAAKNYVLVELFVNPKYRGKGIGTALLQRATLIRSLTKGQPFAVAPPDEKAMALFKKIDTHNKFLYLDNGY